MLPVVLLVGFGTFSRLVAINTEDFWLTAGMNRLRHAYLELAPELEPYFVTGHNDDIPSLVQTNRFDSKPFGIRLILSSTPYVIGAIDALVAGVLVALLAELSGASITVSAVAGVIGGVLLLVVLLEAATRWLEVQRRDYRPRFPG